MAFQLQIFDFERNSIDTMSTEIKKAEKVEIKAVQRMDSGNVEVVDQISEQSSTHTEEIVSQTELPQPIIRKVSVVSITSSSKLKIAQKVPEATQIKEVRFLETTQVKEVCLSETTRTTQTTQIKEVSLESANAVADIAKKVETRVDERGPVRAQYKIVLTPKNPAKNPAKKQATWLINIHSKPKGKSILPPLDPLPARRK
jgi:hypothetical protein